MRKNTLLPILALISLLAFSQAYGQAQTSDFFFPENNNLKKDEDRLLYYKGVAAAKAKDIHLAFMNFRMFLDSSPKSKLAENALFSIGEYYFLTSNYSDAAGAFQRFIKNFPESRAKIFALAYLLEIAKKKTNQEDISALQNEIAASKQLIFLFSESKQYKYKSAFSKNYKALYFIDRIEFYIDEALFTKISF